MTGFTPGLLDRLMSEAGQGLATLTVEQLRDVVARDLEMLLNTRVVPNLYEKYRNARGSVLNYGLADFAGMGLTSSEDRDALCASIRSAIEMHEPRLTEVSAAPDPREHGINRLHIVIMARLLTGASGDSVKFNAVLQPSILHCSISRLSKQNRVYR